jgi:hypothetical protein
VCLGPQNFLNHDIAGYFFYREKHHCLRCVLQATERSLLTALLAKLQTLDPDVLVRDLRALK